MTRYYPGFLAALLIILLRIAIGWHFLYEGMQKYNTTLEGKAPFSAEIYLRNANGPLAPYFREMLPDVDGRETLDLAKLKAAWRKDVDGIVDHFRFTDTQRTDASKRLDEAERWADRWFSDPENAQKRTKYLHDLDQLQKMEQDPRSMEFELERTWEDRRARDSERRSLLAPLTERGKDLRDSVAKLALPDQVRAAGAPLLSKLKHRTATLASDDDAISAAESARPWSRLDVINFATTYGLIAIGGCLILGFMTPLAALGAIAFLAMIYLSMPPWPGLPDNPKTEGHYLIVSKNLIELIACLVVATTPNGHWIGLDALFFGARRRRRLAPPPAPADRAPTSRPGRNPEPERPVPPKGEADRDPIPIG
jgi:uncharacterized membrane protein YphA (DoxX/SURF4 family)